MERGLKDLFAPVKEELEAVDRELEKLFRSSLRRLFSQETLRSSEDFEQLLSAGIVLLVGDLFAKSKNAVLPAMFMKLIHLATRFHHLSMVEDKRQEQLLILGGDYIYAHLFFALCQKNCLHLLERLSNLILMMNEGFAHQEVFKKKVAEPSYENLIRSIEKHYGNFFGEACALGALFAGAEEKDQKLLFHFGINMGIAHGLIKAGMDSKWSYIHVEKALDFLSQLKTIKSKANLEKMASVLVYPQSGAERCAIF
ncbi:MAG: Octaprenyl-diphosphate synthase [Thermoanaerobacterales bacterium 50_218]|nr:MAG: Octaprenyl-diphosphate synthase [Thermoanaerobacterales bacterium 50_218]HAA89506.1 hypothetical protein [Peptococcaceae bacterium]